MIPKPVHPSANQRDPYQAWNGKRGAAQCTIYNLTVKETSNLDSSLQLVPCRSGC